MYGRKSVPAKRSAVQPSYPVVFFVNGIGDHLMALPAIRALAEHFGGRMSLLCHGGAAASVFAGLPIRKITSIRFSSIPQGIGFDAAKTARAIGKCDLFVGLTPWISPSLSRLLQLLHPSVSIGFFPEFDRHVAFSTSVHAADAAMSLVRQIVPGNPKVERYWGAPEVSSRGRQWARSVRKHLPADARIVAVHTDTKFRRRWPIARWEQLLRQLLAFDDRLYLFVHGMQQTRLDHLRHERVISCKGLPLENAISLVCQSDYFLGIDSCFLHAADLADVPGLGLFGPSDPREFGFRNSLGQHIRFSRRMKDISVDAVYRQFTALLASGQ